MIRVTSTPGNPVLIGAGVGAAGVGALTCVQAVSHTVSPGILFPPISLAQWLVQRAPGSLDTFAIERLGHAALPIVALAAATVILAAGGVLGAFLTAWRGPETAVVVPVLVGATTMFLPGVAGPWSVVAVAVGALVAWFVARWAQPSRNPIAATNGHHRASAGGSAFGRRTLLLALGAGAAAMGLGLQGPGGPWRRAADPGIPLDVLGYQERASTPPPGDAAFARIEGSTPRLTPVEDFYVVDEALADPIVDPLTWRLSIGGVVERPLEWSLDDLLAMPAVERYQTLGCISDPVGGPLISTTRWTGVPLARLLDAAGPRPEVVEVVFRSADGYSESLPLEVASDPNTLIAYGMDGRALPVAHGFPARVLSTGTYGMKNPKWLQSIELVDRPYDGFWETRGWSKAATVKTWCRIDAPVSGRRGSGPTAIAGIAFAGDRGISRVEVSTDDGDTWSPAEIETELSRFTWVRWWFDWRPFRTGLHTIRARAIDGTGVVQTSAFAPPHPDGASGYPVIAFTIDAT